MEVLKPATTYDQQLELFRNRGIIISDEKRCKAILSEINYYRFTAYLLPFKKPDGSYQAGTSIEKVYQIYEFDRRLRSILLSAIEEIEILFRAKISYFHAHKYGPEGYCNPDNFSKFHDDIKSKEELQREIKYNQKSAFIKHHIEKYEGHFPIWVAVEIFTFGMLSKFYSDLKVADQKSVIESIYGEYHDSNITYKNVKSWLYCCANLRNICAHYGRLYFLKFASVPGGIENLSSKQKHSLWAQFLAIKSLYPNAEKWNNEICSQLSALFDKSSANISYSHIGFPVDWEQQIMK